MVVELSAAVQNPLAQFAHEHEQLPLVLFRTSSSATNPMRGYAHVLLERLLMAETLLAFDTGIRLLAGVSPVVVDDRLRGTRSVSAARRAGPPEVSDAAGSRQKVRHVSAE